MEQQYNKALYLRLSRDDEMCGKSGAYICSARYFNGSIVRSKISGSQANMLIMAGRERIMFDQVDFGKRVREFRTRNGYCQKETSRYRQWDMHNKNHGSVNGYIPWFLHITAKKNLIAKRFLSCGKARNPQEYCMYFKDFGRGCGEKMPKIRRARDTKQALISYEWLFLF